MLQTDTVLKKSDLYLLLAIVLLTLATYSPVIWHDFINYDDPAFVIMNPNIQSGFTLQGIRWAFTTGYEANWIPLTWLSHMLDVQLFGLNPAGHHIVNVLLHAASTGLLFMFFLRTTGSRWQSATVALLFALHPLHVESVAWVAERKDVLSAFFWMLTLCTYARYVTRPDSTRYLTVLGMFTLGLLAKPMLVTLPLVLLLLDYWPLGRFRDAEGLKSDPNTTLSRLAIEKVPMLALSIGASVITYLAQQTQGSISQSYTMQARAARALTSYISYLGKTFWPSRLAVIYPFPKYPPSTATITAAAVALIITTGTVYWLRRRHPYLTFGWMWYLITLLPVIGLVQIGQHSVADRYTYLPLIGIFVMIAWGVPDFMPDWRRRKKVLSSVVVAGLVVMIIVTSLQLRHWRNSFILFRHALLVTEDNWIAHNNLGIEHLEKGRVNEAIRQYNLAVRAKPTFVPAYLNLGFAYRLKGDISQSVNAYRSALQFDPNNESAHLAMGLLYLELGSRALSLAEYQFLQSTGSQHAPELMKEIAKSYAANTKPR